MPTNDPPATVRLEPVDPEDPRAVEAVRRYVAELDGRFPGGFAPGPMPAEPDATYVLATSEGRPVAYGGIRPQPPIPGESSPMDRVAEIKRMWVDDGWRGAGLGSRMLRHLEDLAREQGYTQVALDTNGTLSEAIAMYERFGYRRIARYNDNPYAEAFFVKPL